MRAVDSKPRRKFTNPLLHNVGTQRKFADQSQAKRSLSKERNKITPPNSEGFRPSLRNLATK